MPNRRNQLWAQVKAIAPISILSYVLDRKISYRQSTIASLTTDLAQINNLFNRPFLAGIRARRPVELPIRYLIRYNIIKIDVDSKKVDSSGLSIIVKKKPETKEDRKKLFETLKTYSKRDINEEGYAGNNVIIPSDVDYKNMSKRQLLKNKRKFLNRAIREAKRSEIRETPEGFNGIILRDTQAPDYWSLGIQGDTGDYENECVATAIMSFQCESQRNKNITRTKIYQDMDCKRGDPITIKMVYDYHKKNNLKAYFVDGTNRLINMIDGDSSHFKVGFYKINNQHIYPIHDKDTQNEIIYTKMIHPANLLKCKDADIIRFNDRKNIDDYEQKVIVMSQDQLTAEIKGAFECGLMVENISCSSNGSINKCSYKNKWLIVFDDYEMVINVLSICREFKEIKNIKKLLDSFTYQGQTLQSITRQLMEVFNRRLTSSVYNDDVFNTFKSLMHGGYDKTVGSGVGEEGKKYIGADVRRCYTSCLYNRKHCWGLFRPLDQFTKYTGLFEGAYYIIKDCKLDIINLGDGIYDSEFVEYALNNDLIKEEQITHQIKPFYSLPNDHFVKIIDLIYDRFDDKTAKSLINRFCGTLNPSGNSIDKCFLTNDINMRNEFLNQDEKNQSNTLIEGQLYECYSQTQQKIIKSNMNIWNSLVCGGYVNLHKLYKQMIQFGPVTHFKTDCVSVECKSSDDYDRFRSFINTQEDTKYGLGKIRACDGTQGYKPDDGHRKRIDYRLKSRVFDKCTNPESITLPKGNMGIFVHGSAGCGKTYTLVNKILPLLEDGTYIVSSTANKALCNLEDHGVNKNDLKNLMEVFSTKNFNKMIYDGKIKTLIVDEYTMTGVRYMTLIYQLFIEHNFRIIFVGDDKQIPSVDTRNIKYHDKQFFKEMIDLDIELTTQHRSNQGLTDTAMKVYNDGEFKCDRVGECDMNICYLRSTCDKINAKFSKRYEEDGFKGHNNFYYGVDAPVICFTNKFKKGYDGDDEELGFINGSCFKIEEFNDDLKYVSLLKYDYEYPICEDDEDQDEDLTDEQYDELLKNRVYISLYDFQVNFTLAHAITTHKLQGTTLKGKVSIHDTNLMKRELLYTAITRLTTLDNLYVPEPVELKNINHYKFNTNKDKDYTYDFTNKKHFTYLYSVIYSDGSMSDIKASEFLDEHKDEEIHIIKSFEYNDLDELKKELEKQNNLKKFKKIKEGKYKRVQREIKNRKGGIDTKIRKGKTIVRFRIKIRGKKYEKQWAVGRKRTLEQAMDLAIAHQIEMSN